MIQGWYTVQPLNIEALTKYVIALPYNIRYTLDPEVMLQALCSCGHLDIIVSNFMLLRVA